MGASCYPGYLFKAAELEKIRKSRYQSNLGSFMYSIRSSKELLKNRRSVVAIAGKHPKDKHYWAAITAIRLGTQKDDLKKVIPIKVSLTEILATKHLYHTTPVFITTFPATTRIYASFDLVDGSRTKPILVLIE